MTGSDPATAVGPDPKQTDVGSVFVSNYPPYSFWTADRVGEVERVLDTAGDPERGFGLYLHIPFCRKRCKFCYFKVYTDKRNSEIQAYTEALVEELRMYAARPALAGRPLKFVYVGGGTPSFISARHLQALVAGLKSVMPWDQVEEVTFEREPGTLTRPKLEAIRGVGVTRLSLGVENFDDTILEENGRAHLTKEIDRVAPWVREIGFDQVNIDLISGMVGETWDTWKRTVRLAVEMDPDSVTIYQMELPYNTVYSRSKLDGSEVSVADWETKRAWHGYAIDELSAAGYEISSAYTMVKPGRNARFAYRDALWHGSDLLGIGVSSFSHLGGVHYQNTSVFEQYVETVGQGRLPLDRAYPTDARERCIRELILQLKLGQIDCAYFQNKFSVDVSAEFSAAFDELEREGMLEREADIVRLTRQGLLRVDQLLPRFYQPQHQNARYT